jgi:hypothetical protein
LEFLEAAFLGVAMESILGDEVVLSRQTRATTQKNNNFSSDRWIALKCLQQFIEAVFLGVAMESILGDEEVLLGEIRVTAQKGHNF